MTFIYALIPISCVAAVLSTGNAGIAMCLCISIPLVLSLFPIKSRFKFCDLLTIPLFLFAISLHAYSVYAACVVGLGSLVAGILSAVCVIFAVISAYKGKGAEYASLPIFFISAVLALYTLIVSMNGDVRILSHYPNRAELLSSIVCPVALCLSLPSVNNVSRSEAFTGYVSGLCVSAVFILCSGAETEFGFICVPLAVLASAFNAKAAIKCILSLKGE